jgi:hypothetical protein
MCDSPAMDGLVVAQQQELDPGARAEIFDQIQRLAADDSGGRAGGGSLRRYLLTRAAPTLPHAADPLDGGVLVAAGGGPRPVGARCPAALRARPERNR